MREVILLQAFLDRFQSLWEEALSIWLAGGWAMIAIAAISLVMFGLGLQIQLNSFGEGFSVFTRKDMATLDRPPNRKERPHRPDPRFRDRWKNPRRYQGILRRTEGS